MKIDLAVSAAALNEVFERNHVAPQGAVPFWYLESRWKDTNLRKSDFLKIIERLHREGHVELEVRGSGCWVRRCGGAESPGGLFDRLRAKFRKAIVGRTLEQLHEREEKEYAGMDRRRARQLSE